MLKRQTIQRSASCGPLFRLMTALGLVSVAASAATIIPGYLKYEYYPGKVRDDVKNGTAGAPSTAGTVQGSDKSGYVFSFESGTNFAENYANRISGFFVPPTTGNYVFFVAADDDTDLFLSTDSDPANKKLIAQEAGWSAVRSYNTIGGTSTVEDKRSDQATVSEWPGAVGAGATINLTAGQRYYIEAVHHEGGGGDNLAVTYKLASEPDPANGDAPKLTGSVIAVSLDAAPANPNLSVAVQPVGGTFYTGQPLSMFVVANSASPFPLRYQWRLNGTNIAGATTSSYQVNAASTNNAGSYDVVITVADSTGTPVSVNSSAVNVEVKNVLEEVVTGKLRYEYYANADRPSVEAGTAGAPGGTGTTVGNDASGYISIAESGTNFADNYANRVSGFFIPPTTGDYVFYVAADDDTDLFLSTDETAANKKMIAQETGWSGVRNYNTIGGTSTPEAKRSDLFPNSEWPGAEGAGATINLTAGKKYYIEAVHHEGGGGDNLAITYRLASEDETLTADGTAPRLTGEVIAASIPQIMSIAAGQPTVQRFSFTINDSGTSVLDPATVKLTFDGQLVTPTSTPKVNGITAFTYNLPTQVAPGSTHYYSIQATDTKGQPVTRSAQYTLPQPWFPTANLNGPSPVEGAWASRFIHTITDTNFTAIDVTGLANIISLINRVGGPDLIAEVIDQTNDVVNFNAGGFFGNPVAYPDGLAADDFINLNIGHIVINEEGDYTFGVHSDDGFGLRIRGGQVVRVSGAGQIDPADPEAVVHPADTGDSGTRAVYHLKQGIYRIEFFWWENGGGDFGEIYAAKGNFANDSDTTDWRLIGDPAPAQELTVLGVDAAGWSVISSTPYAASDTNPAIVGWADANEKLAATGGGAKTYDFLNVGDPDSNPGVQAFPKDVAGTGDDNFVLKATATLVVPQDGTYLLGFNSDDGAYMKVPGHNFGEIQQNNTGLSVIDGDTVICDCPTGDSGTTATITLTKGNYPIEFGSFEIGGGAFLAGKGVLLPANPVTTIDMPFLAKNGAGTKVTTITSLKLTSQAANGGNGGGGNGPSATITITGTSLTISSTDGGTVEATDSLTSPNWQSLGAAPQTVQATGNYRFFRIKK